MKDYRSGTGQHYFATHGRIPVPIPGSGAAGVPSKSMGGRMKEGNMV
ncbi:MAG: hypothetical protein GXY92_07945 [Syntrophomonadaceae bacterium]|nr:hypothetical protein [Syntrophomonadaceae bacterium]